MGSAASSLALTPTPSSVAFVYQIGGANPAPQSLSISGARVGFSATAVSANSWLSVTPTNNMTPALLSVSANPSGLLAGIHSGVIIITPYSLTDGTPQVVEVTLAVSSTGPQALSTPVPVITSVVNGASLVMGLIAPGEIISIFGRDLGPSNGASLNVTPSGVVDNELSGTKVIIDGKASPLLFAQAGRVTAIVPYSVVGKATVQGYVEYHGVRSDLESLTVAEAAPAVFTINGSGQGQGAILNGESSDNSSRNSPA